MTKSKNQVALNEENIRKNKRHIFELECQASTSYAESLLLIADIEENRALLSRNFSAAFNGNRAIAVDNIEDLYRCRMLMVDALTAKTDVQQNFKSAMGNSLRIDLLENKFYLNEQLQAVAEQMAAINEMLTSLNEMIADSNENLPTRARRWCQRTQAGLMVKSTKCSRRHLQTAMLIWSKAMRTGWKA